MSLTKGPRGTPSARTANPAPEQGTGEASGHRESRGGFGAMRSRYETSIVRNPASGNMKKFKTHLQDMLIENDAKNLRILTLDKANACTAADGILVCTSVRKPDGTEVALVHTMLVEASIEGGLQPRTEQIGGRPVDILITAGDVYDDYYWGKVQALVSAAYDGIPVYEAGQQILPRELEPDNLDNLLIILWNADAALTATAQRVSDNIPDGISVDDFQAGDRFVGKIDTAPQAWHTPAGLPIRSDLAIAIAGQSPQDGQRNLGQNAATDLVTVHTAINLIYEAPKRDSRDSRNDETEYFTPEVIITDVDTKIGCPTLGTTLLGLHGVSSLGKHANWALAFQKRMGNNDPLRDIGAIGYDIPDLTNDENRRQKVNTQTSTFTQKDLADLILGNIRQDVIYSIDIDERGPTSWLQGVWEAAANGDRLAEEEIIRAANELTGDRFSDHFSGGPLMVNREERIHLGYYTDRHTGRVVDLRKIDYLAMLNLSGEVDYDAVLDYDQTFNNTTDMAVRLARRLEILNGAVGETLRVTGFARRYTFSPALIEALNMAMESSKCAIQFPSMPNDMTGTARRASGSVSSLAVSSRSMAGMFNSRRQGNDSGMSRRASNWRR